MSLSGTFGTLSTDTENVRLAVKTGGNPLVGQREALASFATLTEPLKKT
jgi:hypothetical protein